MQDQRTPAERFGAIERDILYSLAAEDGTQSIWTVAELGCDVGSADDADMAVHTLKRAGLVHQTSDGFVFASRAGVHAVGLVGHVV
jgi:hypothetical protein